jgi:mannose/cellobiose epimerase-like protein (N-acyl-D-glucosamine 2-epimerase family)
MQKTSKKLGLFLLSLVFVFSGQVIAVTACAKDTACVKDKAPHVPTYDIAQIIAALPDGRKWLVHLNDDLLPFWTMKTALGNPLGKFPTYRANDGSLIEPNNLPPEYEAALADPGLRELIKLNRLYIRGQGRQTFAYGIAYHMTGKEKYLNLAKEGVDFFKQHAIDWKTGGAYSYQRKKQQEWAPEVLERTSQDMAYALSGIGFYYYLTRDKSVLDDILFIKNHIFNTYFDKEWGLLKWVLESSPDGDSPKQKELVSQLDQVYAYMLWLTESLPEPHQTKWKEDLHKIASLMIEQFFSTEYQFFWGRITTPTDKMLGKPHTDFGHSIKTLWLIYQIGKHSNDIDMVNFARNAAAKIIDVAYLEDGSWARAYDANGNLDHNKEWWILAELDQTTATLSLVDPSYARYLVTTYPYWFKYMVDHTYKGVWHWVNAETNESELKFPKQHSWKNALHTFEHALVGYLTTQQLKGENMTLYYAFKHPSSAAYIHPYFFQAKIDGFSVKEMRNPYLQDYKKYKVEFSDLR